MKKISLLLFSAIVLASLDLMGQDVQVGDSRYECSCSQEYEFINGSTCYFLCDKYLVGFDLVENNEPVFMMAFRTPNEFKNNQLLYVMTEVEPNDIPMPEEAHYVPGFMFKRKCLCENFYDSGNPKESYTYLFDDNPEVDGYECGERIKYEDFGVAEHRQYEVNGISIYDTLLDGKLNGAQIYITEPGKKVGKINFYKLGELQAQFMFDEEGKLKSIAYDITPNGRTDEYGHSCKYIEYNLDGSKRVTGTRQFNMPPCGEELQLH